MFPRPALTDTTLIILLVVLRMVTGGRSILSTACSLGRGPGIGSTTCTLRSISSGTDLDMSTFPASGTSIGSEAVTGTMMTVGVITIVDGMDASTIITMTGMMTTNAASMAGF